MKSLSTKFKNKKLFLYLSSNWLIVVEVTEISDAVEDTLLMDLDMLRIMVLQQLINILISNLNKLIFRAKD